MSEELGRLDVTTADILDYASDIVSAYVSNNPIQSAELPELIRDVHTTLRALESGSAPQVVQEPAVSAKKSITDEFLICLEDGKKFKSLKRHCDPSMA